MNLTKFNEQVNIVRRIVALCGESSVITADGLGRDGIGPSVFLSAAGFAVLSAGQTVSEKTYSGQRESFFYAQGIKFWRATSLADEQPRTYTQPGKPINLGDPADVISDVPNEGSTIVSNAEAREVLADQTPYYTDCTEKARAM